MDLVFHLIIITEQHCLMKIVAPKKFFERCVTRCLFPSEILEFGLLATCRCPLDFFFYPKDVRLELVLRAFHICKIQKYFPGRFGAGFLVNPDFIY